jgi:hypothetical protein
MGLFDKKKKGDDDYDSPVEQVSLSTPKPAAPGTVATPAGSQARPASTTTPAQSAPQPAAPVLPSSQPGAQSLASAPAAPAPAASRARPPQDDFDVPNYGIEKAIELMRLLPADNVELVVQVVKKTLESLQIQVPSIIKDASRKQSDIEGRIDVLKKEIFELESEISTRKTEISALEADHKETTSVKERLILAEKLTDERKGTSPGVAVSSPPSNTTPAGAVPAPTPAPRPSGTFQAVTPGGGGTMPPPVGSPSTTPAAPAGQIKK